MFNLIDLKKKKKLSKSNQKLGCHNGKFSFSLIDFFIQNVTIFRIGQHICRSPSLKANCLHGFGVKLRNPY